MKNTILLLLSTFFFIACNSSNQESKDKKDDTKQSVVLKELPAKNLEKASAVTLDKKYQKVDSKQTKDGMTIEMYKIGNDSLNMRYNPAFFRILDKDGSAITNADTYLETFMGMGSQGHGSPVLQPTYDPQTQLYAGGVVYSMPGKWDVHFAMSNGQSVEFTVPITYPKGSETLMEADNGTDDNFYNVSLMSPRVFIKGNNDFSIMVNIMKEDMVSFPPADGLSIKLHPVNATAKDTAALGTTLDTHLTGKGNGIYSGAINLPEPGLWDLNFELKKGDSILIKQIQLVVAF